MNLEAPGALSLLSRTLLSEIDTYCADKYDEGPRSHLGASEIGHNCCCYLWFKFRWLTHIKHSGRLQRLFQRGHFEEPRFVQYLEGIGFEVQCFDKTLLWHPESECLYYGSKEDVEKGHVDDVEGIAEFEAKAKELGIWLDKGKRQIRISDCLGHFGGSLDGIAFRIDIGKILAEFKTQGTGKKFTELKEKGVKLCKPVHYAQMSMYGYKLGLKYAIYMAVNKNDDDLHVEIVELDWKLGADLCRKAEMVIFSETPPPRIAESPAYFECSYCDMLNICHKNGVPLKNCRSCKKCRPVDNAEWFCSHYANNVPKEYIPQGCGEWISIL